MKENLILLIEDCPEDASLLLHAFKKWGITNRVQVMRTGEQSVDYLAGKGPYTDRDAHPLPSLALLDLDLPTMSGFDVLKWVRARPDLVDLPVIVLSGGPDGEQFNRAHRLGAIACVTKGNDLAEMRELIQHLDYFSRASDLMNSAVDWSPEP
jgi:two-component system response regulator